MCPFVLGVTLCVWRLCLLWAIGCAVCILQARGGTLCAVSQWALGVTLCVLCLCVLGARLCGVRLLLARGGTLCVVGGVRRRSLRLSMVHCLCRRFMPPLVALTRLFGPQLPKQPECLGGPLRVVCLRPVLGGIRCAVRRGVLGARSCVVCLLLARRGTL